MIAVASVDPLCAYVGSLRPIGTDVVRISPAFGLGRPLMFSMFRTRPHFWFKPPPRQTACGRCVYSMSTRLPCKKSPSRPKYSLEGSLDCSSCYGIGVHQAEKLMNPCRGAPNRKIKAVRLESYKDDTLDRISPMRPQT